jgi:hypothetical protein
MRRNTRIAAFCIAALILWSIPVDGISFSATLSESGKTYNATVVVNNTDRYEFIQPGMIGERIPLQVLNLTVHNETGPVQMTPDRGVLSFPRGNYTLTYEAAVPSNTLQILFAEPANVSFTLPHPYMVSNPLLASLQPSGYKVETVNNTTQVFWGQQRSVEIRYYDEGQEQLLFIFAQFWLIIAL